jgi:hypothetical protein
VVTPVIGPGVVDIAPLWSMELEFSKDGVFQISPQGQACVSPIDSAWFTYGLEVTTTVFGRKDCAGAPARSR